MYDLNHFRLKDMAECGAALRKLGAEATNMGQVAQRTVHHLYSSLVDKDSQAPACALVRFFKTHPYNGLDPELQDFARGMLGGEPRVPRMPCLTLLASVGDEPAWNDRRRSEGHQAIPLSSVQMVEHSPMIAQLIKQLGIDVATVLEPDATLMVNQEQRTFNVFHVADAPGSPYVPAQDEFVVPYGIRSVLGCGGMLPTGELFATILFSKVSIPRTTAEMFASVALNIKVAILPFTDRPLFG